MSDMLYFVGWSEPEAIFILRCVDGSWVSTLFVQPKDTLKEIWEGRRPGVEGALAHWPIDEAHSLTRHDETIIFIHLSIHLIEFSCEPEFAADVDDFIRSAIERRDRVTPALWFGSSVSRGPQCSYC